MPTGYTAEILDGKITTFPQFAKQCMRAFGATIHMRDDDMDAEFTPRTPSDYYAKEIKKANQVIKEAELLTDEEIIDARKKELQESKASYTKGIQECNNGRIALEKILIDVTKWQPPTSDHVGIKKFMIEQINTTIDHDCKTEYYDKGIAAIESELATLNPKQIRKDMIGKAMKNLEYHVKENGLEIKRCKESNKWVEDFVSSL